MSWRGVIISCHKRIYVLKGGGVIIPCHNSFPPYIKFSTVSPNMSAAFPFLISFIAVSTSFKVGAFRDRPFNLEGGVMVFSYVQKLFFGQHKSQNILFLSRKARNFFPEFNIRLYDKISESDFFFFLHQNQNIFFSNIGNQNIFFRKKP